MAKSVSKKVSKQEVSDSKVYAFLTVFLSIIGFIIALLAWKKDNYVMFYAKQSLGLFIAYIIAWIISMILFWIPILGWIILSLVYLGLIILWVISWINALSGEMKETPLIGLLVEKIQL